MELESQLSRLNDKLIKLFREEDDEDVKQQIKTQFNRNSLLIGQLVHRNVNEATAHYVAVTTKLASANQALEDALKQIKQVAETIQQVAEAIDKAVELAGTAT